MSKYIYICSAGHSGSTLLDLLIGSHSMVESLGEMSHLSGSLSLNTLSLSLNTFCTCGQPVRSCSIWQKIVERLNDCLEINMWKDPYALNLFPRVIIDKAHQNSIFKIHGKLLLILWYVQLRFRMNFLKPLLRPVYESIENNFLLYDAARIVLRADAIVDSSKHYLKAVGLYKRNPDKVKIILLTRDGRGVFYSNIKRNFSKKKSLNGWKNHYSRAFKLFDRHVDEKHILLVKYENLVINPTKELMRICNFIGLEFEKEMLDFAFRPHHSINGNNMRFSKSSVIRPDIEWHDKLSEIDRQYFELIAGELNHKLGYE